MKYCIPFVFVAFTCLALGADFSIRPEGDAVTIHGSEGNIDHSDMLTLGPGRSTMPNGRTTTL